MEKRFRIVVVSLSVVLVIVLCILFIVFGGFSVLSTGQQYAQVSPEDQQYAQVSPEDQQYAQVSPEDQQYAQVKAMDFMENVLPLELSEYVITLESELPVELPIEWASYYKQRINLCYLLVPMNSFESSDNLRVFFEVEAGIISHYHIQGDNQDVTINPQYDSLFDAVTIFLERYQTYTKIDSSNLISMLYSVDMTKDCTVSAENIKLAITKNIYDDKTYFMWTYSDNGFDYAALHVDFNEYGFVIAVYDTRALFTMGDTSINVSEEQAIIAD